MKRINIFISVTLVLTFLAFAPNVESQIRPPVFQLPPPRPLCAPQLALVSYACGMISYTPGLPPPILPPPSPDDDNGHRSHLDNDKGHQSHPDNDKGHRSHHHRHDHKHRHRGTDQEENCCRWAREMDSRCVCEILVRLPPFLTRPAHQYSVVIGESCTITYTCGGPI